MENKERKSNSDTLYEVVSLVSEAERERRKTTASPGILTAGSMVPSPPEDDEEEGERPSAVIHIVMYITSRVLQEFIYFSMCEDFPEPQKPLPLSSQIMMSRY